MYLDDNRIADASGLIGLTKLQTVSITGNPLGNNAYGTGGTVSLLQAAGATVTYTPDPNAPVLQPISPQGISPQLNTAATGSEPSSVAVGDFNGDGKEDLAVANYGSNTLSILLGNGNGTFQTQQTLATGSGPGPVVVGDFNGDGKEDLAVVNEASNTVSVFLGNGNGTFQAQQTFATGTSPSSVAVGDFNGDGKLDLAVANYSSETLSVLLNTTTVGATTASFATQQTYATGALPASIAVGDFNGDGKTDLVVANETSETVSVLLGNGNGTFQPQQTFAAGGRPVSVAVGDFNGDGKADLAVADYISNTVSVFLGNGNGTFQPQQTFAAGGRPVSVAVGDFNGDGKVDLAVANGGSNTVSVLLGNGNGTFQTQQTFSTGTQADSVAVGDFNGDGKEDLVAANNGSNTVSVLTGLGNGTFTPYSPLTLTLAATDADTGDPVFYTASVAPSTAAVVSVAGNQLTLIPSATFTGAAQVTVTAYDGPSGERDWRGRSSSSQTFDFNVGTAAIYGTVYQDLNENHVQDAGESGQPFFQVGLYNSGNVLIAGPVTSDYEGVSGNYAFTNLPAGTTGTVRVLTPTVAAAGLDGNWTTLYPVSGYAITTALTAGQVVQGDNFAESLVLAPLANQLPSSAPEGTTISLGLTTANSDLAVVNSGSNTVSVLLGNGNGTFQTQQTFAAGSSGQNSVAVGDFNGDGKTDLAVANYASGSVSVLLGNGNGTFQTQQTFATGASPESVVVGDFNGDGNADLAVANYGSNTLSVLLGNGNGTFQTQQTFATGSGPDSIVVGDFNGDGKEDLAVVNRNSNTVSVFLGNGNGTFQAQQTFATGSLPYSLTAGDFNGDGKVDLAVANYGSNTLSILLGNGNGTFQPQQTYATGASPESIAVGDFNGDGNADLAVADSASGEVSVFLGNGNGTFQAQQTFATGAGPDSVAVGDFNGDGNADLAVVNYGSNTISVLLGNGNGTFQTQRTFATGSSPWSLAVGDFNNANATLHDPTSGMVHQFKYAWTVAFNGNAYGTSGNTQSYSFPLTTAGTYAVTLTVQEWNSTGTINLGSYTQTASVTCTPAPPTSVSAGTGYTINAGSSLTLSGSAYDPLGSANPLTYSWDVNGDGVYGDATGANPTLTWAQLGSLGITSGPGPYEVSLRATTADGLSATSPPVTLTINMPPANVSAGTSYTINEGSPLSLSSSATNPSGNNSQLAYSWDIDGVSGDATGANPTLTWSQLNALGITQGPATFEVSVTVTNSGSGLTTTSAPVTVTVVNLPPTNVSAGTGYTIDEGSSLTLLASASDPSGNTSQLTYSWDINGDGIYGDATGANPTLTWTQLNALGITQGPATFQVSVRVTDNNGSGLSTTSAPVTLTIVDLPPTNVSAGGSYTVVEGGSLSLLASAGDPSGNTSQLSYSWDINGDGIFGDAVGQNPLLTWADLIGILGNTQAGDTYQVAVQVTDQGGEVVTSASTSLTVLSAAPSNVSAGGPYTITPGNSITLTGSASLPIGVTDPVSYSWAVNGDDSSSGASGQTVTLSWAQLVSLGIGQGTDPINVTMQAVNDDGDLANDSTPVPLYVTSQAPTVATEATAVPSSVTGTTASLSVLGDDAGGESDLTYTWSTIGIPPSPVSFSANGSNAAKNTTVTFSAAGSYAFQVAISDTDGLTTTSTVVVDVAPTLTSLSVSPSSAALAGGATQQFTAVAYDQFGDVLTQPTLTWSVAGSGSIDSSGLYTSPYATGSATVSAGIGLLTSTASVTYAGQAQWNADTNGSWSTNGDWVDTVSGAAIAPPGLRGAVGDTVLISSAAGSTITLDGANPSVAGITFNSSTTSYTISQGTGGALDFSNGEGNASITVSSGSHVISAPVVLNSSLFVAPTSGSTLAISGPISGVGSSVTLSDQGTLILSGANSFTGGVIVNAGALYLGSQQAIPTGSSLTVGAGGAFALDSSATAAPLVSAGTVTDTPAVAASASTFANSQPILTTTVSGAAALQADVALSESAATISTVPIVSDTTSAEAVLPPNAISAATRETATPSALERAATAKIAKSQDKWGTVNVASGNASQTIIRGDTTAASASDPVVASRSFGPQPLLVGASQPARARSTAEVPADRTSAAAKAKDIVFSGALRDAAVSDAAWLWSLLDAQNQKNKSGQQQDTAAAVDKLLATMAD